MNTPPDKLSPTADIAVRAWTVSCAVGRGRQALARAVQSNATGLKHSADPALRPLWDEVMGQSRPPPSCLVGPLPLMHGKPASDSPASNRALRLAAQALEEDDWTAMVARAKSRWGAGRIGLVLGTSASTIASTEASYRHALVGGLTAGAGSAPQLDNPHGVTRFLLETWGLEGPAQTVSTACSSSAKAFAVARRWLLHDQADAVIVAGVEALCGSLLHGFGSLGLLSPSQCRPFDAERSGIAIGEAAGFALLERGTGPVQLLACGEASDAHHMSAPHPQGLGARLAVEAALRQAALDAHEVGYLNLHGTGTAHNDAIEALVLDQIYPDGVHASATKGLTGHAMGASGIVEAGLCFLALEEQLLSGSPGLHRIDPSLPARVEQLLRREPAQREVDVAVSHSFGFGGSNAVLVFGRRASSSRGGAA